jgi:hypothetical protein
VMTDKLALDQQLQAKDDEIQISKSSYNQQVAIIADLKKQIEDSLSENAQLQSDILLKISETETKDIANSEKLSDRWKRIQNLSEEKDALVDEKKQLSEELATLRSTILSQETKNKNLIDELDITRAFLAASERQITEKTEKIEKLSEKLSTETGKIMQLTADWLNERKENNRFNLGKEQTIASQSIKINELKQSIEQLGLDHNIVKDDYLKKITDLETNLKNEISKLKFTEEELKSKELAFEEMRKQLAEVEANLTNVNAYFETEISTHKKDFEKKNHKYEQQIGVLNQEKAQLEEDIKSSRSLNQDLQNQIDNFEEKRSGVVDQQKIETQLAKVKSQLISQAVAFNNERAKEKKRYDELSIEFAEFKVQSNSYPRNSSRRSQTFVTPKLIDLPSSSSTAIAIVPIEDSFSAATSEEVSLPLSSPTAAILPYDSPTVLFDRQISARNEAIKFCNQTIVNIKKQKISDDTYATVFTKIISEISLALQHIQSLPFENFLELLNVSNTILKSEKAISYKWSNSSNYIFAHDLILVISSDKIDDNDLNLMLQSLAKNVKTLAGIEIKRCTLITGEGIKDAADAFLLNNLEINWRWLNLIDLQSLNFSKYITSALINLPTIKCLEFNDNSLSPELIKDLDERYILKCKAIGHDNREKKIKDLKKYLQHIHDQIFTDINVKETPHISASSVKSINKAGPKILQAAYKNALSKISSFIKNKGHAPEDQDNLKEINASIIPAASYLDNWNFMTSKSVDTYYLRNLAIVINKHFKAVRRIDLTESKKITWDGIQKMGEIKRISALILRSSTFSASSSVTAADALIPYFPNLTTFDAQVRKHKSPLIDSSLTEQIENYFSGLAAPYINGIQILDSSNQNRAYRTVYKGLETKASLMSVTEESESLPNSVNVSILSQAAASE